MRTRGYATRRSGMRRSRLASDDGQWTAWNRGMQRNRNGTRDDRWWRRARPRAAMVDDNGRQQVVFDLRLECLPHVHRRDLQRLAVFRDRAPSDEDALLAEHVGDLAVGERRLRI